MEETEAATQEVVDNVHLSFQLLKDVGEPRKEWNYGTTDVFVERC